jgi:trans-aconitate 2-methyltransferase
MAQSVGANAVWDPGQYAKFADERLRPGFELMGRVPPLPAGDVVDLGCGAGEHLRELASRLPGRRAIGIDFSADMLAKARAAAPGLHWVEADIGAWAPGEAPALLFANASLQWLDDHARLMPRLLSCLAPGGVLAVQMPSNAHAAAHAIARDVCREIGRADLIEALKSGTTVLEAAAYFDLLSAAGAVDLDVWETTYLHALGAAGVTDWVKGAALRPVLSALPPEEAAAYLDAYDRAVRLAYPARADGVTIFPQKRVFFVARRPA